jgi:transposase
MIITEEQFHRIEDCFPKQRGNVAVSNLNVLNAILYVAEHGCKWRGLPTRFGPLAHDLHPDEPLGQGWRP